MRLFRTLFLFLVLFSAGSVFALTPTLNNDYILCINGECVNGFIVIGGSKGVTADYDGNLKHAQFAYECKHKKKPSGIFHVRGLEEKNGETEEQCDKYSRRDDLAIFNMVTSPEGRLLHQSEPDFAAFRNSITGNYNECKVPSPTFFAVVILLTPLVYLLTKKYLKK